MSIDNADVWSMEISFGAKDLNAPIFAASKNSCASGIKGNSIDWTFVSSRRRSQVEAFYETFMRHLLFNSYEFLVQIPNSDSVVLRAGGKNIMF